MEKLQLPGRIYIQMEIIGLAFPLILAGMIGPNALIPGTGTVTIRNSSSSDNGKRGLVVFAKGSVTITSMYAGGNEEDGFLIDNTFSPSAPVVTLTDLEVSGGSTDELDDWYQATDNGINLNIKGPATLKDVVVYDNPWMGSILSAQVRALITITQASNLFNECRNNGRNGYYIETKGPVTITNLDTHDNGHWGGTSRILMLPPRWR